MPIGAPHVGHAVIDRPYVLAGSVTVHEDGGSGALVSAGTAGTSAGGATGSCSFTGGSSAGLGAFGMGGSSAPHFPQYAPD